MAPVPNPSAPREPLLLHDREDDLTTFDACEIGPERLAVADSWLVRDGTMIGESLHAERFRRSALGLEDPATLERFWQRSLAAIPRVGDWFPRIELVHTSGGVRRRLRLRPAPARSQEHSLAVWSGPDPRTEPLVKGPDLDAMRALQTWAQQERQVGEAVLLDTAGHLSEGATTALLWWRGDTLCITPNPTADHPRVDSITERVLRTIALARGISVSTESATPESLAGCAVWTCNALHGVRSVSTFLASDGTRIEIAPDPERAARWQQRLERLRRPITVPPTPLP